MSFFERLFGTDKLQAGMIEHSAQISGLSDQFTGLSQSVAGLSKDTAEQVTELSNRFTEMSENLADISDAANSDKIVIACVIATAVAVTAITCLIAFFIYQGVKHEKEKNSKLQDPAHPNGPLIDLTENRLDGDKSVTELTRSQSLSTLGDKAPNANFTDMRETKNTENTAHR